ncbi:MAG: hypothetical protein MUC36_24610 [Planctomycetes bacterium]|jgi:hypothetical protein|nr:hypothetical protein [Planctomycetota bacterium]
MKILSMLAVAGFCATGIAQSSLPVNPSAPSQNFSFNTPSNNTNIYFNLTVATAVTLREIDTPLLSALGQQGTLSLYLCPVTYVGNEQNASVWQLAATGAIVSRGTAGGVALLTARSCQESASIPNTGLTLLPGSYGIAVRYQGVNPLLTAVASLQTFANAELSVSGGALQYTAFTSALQAPVTAQGFTAWSFQGALNYAVGAGVPHSCPATGSFGEGCYTRCGSFYQQFTGLSPAPLASAAMSGRRLTLVPGSGGYTVQQGTVAFLPPTAAATVLAHGDDTEIQVALPTPFPYPGGVATDFFVHANGFISVASNDTLPGGPNWVPSLGLFLNAPAAGWWSWHDYNPSEAGSGQVSWQQVGSLLVFTWNGVENYPVGTPNPSTWQLQFDLTNGRVHYVWQTIDPIGSGGFLLDDHLVGYSPGGVSPDCGPVDITTLTSVALREPERYPLALTASAAPVPGTTISLDTANVTNPFGFGINFLTLARIPAPGIDLGILGAPGCRALVDINTGVGNAISNTGLGGLTLSISLPVPISPALPGLSIFSQSVWLDAAENPAGLITSNGLELQL